MANYSLLLIAFCALSLRSAFSLRYDQHAMIMAPEGPIVPEVDVDQATKELVEEGEHIEKAMQEEIGLITDSTTAAMCQGSKDEAHCASRISTYVARCKEGDCLSIDAVGYPQNKTFQQLILPDPYQLHAAFVLFKNCRRNASKRWLDRFWMRFSREGRYGAYNSFSLNVLRRNLFEEGDVSALHAFVQKYFYMTAIYYKTYLSLDAINAKIFNKIALAKYILGPKIRRSLKKIVESNKPSDLAANDMNIIRPLTYGYRHYMASQIPALPFFAYRFSTMVIKTLVDNLSGVKQQPWYKRWFGKVKSLFTGKDTSKEAYEIEVPAVIEKTEPVVEEQSVFGKVKDKIGNVLKKSIFRKDTQNVRHSHLSEEDIMGDLSTADALLEPVLDVMENQAVTEGDGKDEAEDTPLPNENDEAEAVQQNADAPSKGSQGAQEEPAGAAEGEEEEETEEQEPEAEKVDDDEKEESSNGGYKKFFKNILDTSKITDAARNIKFPTKYFR
ncbi:rhoptry-associated 1, putative [Babesia ovata]|uniref:Rhoptry-associated 1, putative n=1 Tax=Babesia ovata TaxID=189622 RepID=A0A2H6KBL8_9APIC|nr:rhoptry-associated 1, putative [Babesia ovata]GBE60386.1 rhoptry-associated 1, putative [Babesia ovata]